MPLPQNPLAPVKLDVVARPVDTYVRPAAKGPGMGTQLAEALKEFQPALKGYLQQKKEAKDTATEAAARKQAIHTA